MMLRSHAVLCYLVTALLAMGGETLVAQSVVEVREGTLLFVWGDPQDDRDQPRYTAQLIGANGATIELDLSGLNRAAVSHIQSLSGKLVTVRGTIDAVAGDPAVGGRLHDVLRIGAISGNTTDRQSSVTPAVVRPYAVILCKFSDVAAEPLGRDRYREMYMNHPSSADAFYAETSRGRIRLTGTEVHGWFVLPKPRRAYLNASGEANLGLLVEDCTGVSDAEVDFTRFGGVGLHFNDRLGCCSWGGSWMVNRDGPPRRYPMMWNMDWARSGVVWHELGHSFGLPHSSGPYGRVYDSQWDVMSAARAGRILSADFGRGGAHFVALEKDRIGLIQPAAIVQVTSGVWRGIIAPHSLSATGDTTLLVKVPLDGIRPGRLLAIEARRRRGFDGSLPGDGVLLTTLDPSRAEPTQVVDADGNGNTNDDGAVWRVGSRFTWVEEGITVSVDSAIGSGFAVSVIRSGAVLPSFERAAITVNLPISDTAWRLDSVFVRAPGAWSVTVQQARPWLRLQRGQGIGDGWAVFALRAASVTAPGDVVGTLELGPGSATRRSIVSVRLNVRLVPDVVALSASGSSRVVGVGTSLSQTVAVQLSGQWINARWIAKANRGWAPGGRCLALPAAPCIAFGDSVVGQGPGTFIDGPVSALTPGTRVDTVTVTIAGPSLVTFRIVDTVTTVLDPGIRFSDGTRSRQALVGEELAWDSVQVFLSGPAPSQRWLVTAGSANFEVVRFTGVSGDWLVWRWRPQQARGQFKDSMLVAVDGNTFSQRAWVFGTIEVVDVPLRLRLSASATRSSVRIGEAPRTDSVRIELLGSAGRLTAWTARTSSPSITFHSRDAFTPAAVGNGTAPLRWSRNLDRLSPGQYVDTIVVTAEGALGSPATFIDTTVVLEAASVIGDVDADARITAFDARLVLRSLVDLPIDLPIRVAARLLQNADANCDGRIDVADAILMMQVDVGLPTSGSCIGRRTVSSAASQELRPKAPPRPVPPPGKQ